MVNTSIPHATASVTMECSGKDAYYFILYINEYFGDGLNNVCALIKQDESIIEPRMKEDFVDGTYIFCRYGLARDKDGMEDFMKIIFWKVKNGEVFW